jgi:hypothetical protein
VLSWVISRNFKAAVPIPKCWFKNSPSWAVSKFPSGSSSLDDSASIGIRIHFQRPKNRSSIPDNSKIFVFDVAWRPHLNLTQLSIQWTLLSLYQEFRQLCYTVDSSSPPSTEDECVELRLCSPRLLHSMTLYSTQIRHIYHHANVNVAFSVKVRHPIAQMFTYTLFKPLPPHSEIHCCVETSKDVRLYINKGGTNHNKSRNHFKF